MLLDFLKCTYYWEFIQKSKHILNTVSLSQIWLIKKKSYNCGIRRISLYLSIAVLSPFGSNVDTDELCGKLKLYCHFTLRETLKCYLTFWSLWPNPTGHLNKTFSACISFFLWLCRVLLPAPWRIWECSCSFGRTEYVHTKSNGQNKEGKIKEVAVTSQVDSEWTLLHQYYSIFIPIPLDFLDSSCVYFLFLLFLYNLCCVVFCIIFGEVLHLGWIWLFHVLFILSSICIFQKLFLNDDLIYKGIKVYQTSVPLCEKVKPS